MGIAAEQKLRVIKSSRLQGNLIKVFATRLLAHSQTMHTEKPHRRSLLKDRNTVLIFRLGSIGDTVVALPCFHAIARKFPRSRRVLLTNSLTSARASSAESVLNGTGLIDDFFYYPVGDFSIKQALRLHKTIKSFDPELLIYLAERPSASSVLRDLAFFKAAGIPKIAAAPVTRKLRHCRVDPVTFFQEHKVNRLARTLATLVPVDLTLSNWDLRLSEAEHTRASRLMEIGREGRRLLAIAPGAKIAAKDWGLKNWAALLRGISQEYTEAALVIVGAKDERPLCEALAAQWSGTVLNLCGALTPRETAAALGHCLFLICHDSGPMHLAASQGTRCIALFGNYNRPEKWYPFGEGHVVIYEPRGIEMIRPELVVNAVRTMFGGARAFAEVARRS